MRSTVTRHRLVRVAALASSVALLAACGPSPTPGATPTGPSTPSPSGTPMAPLAAGDVLISDGTNVVTIGDRKVTFPSTVTDAAWSHDGSRIVFVNADGNIATARIDGSSLYVLTTAKAGVTRRRPTWYGGSIFFDARTGSGPWTMTSVSANASGDGYGYGGERTVGSFLADGPETGNSGAMASLAPGGGRELAFEHANGGTAEVWVADTNGRSPYGVKIANGTEASLSPDGMRVAYVANGQIQVADATAEKPKPVQVTFGVAARTRLAWSPDGTHIAFSTPKDVEWVLASVKAGAKSNPTTPLSASPGVATFLPPARDQVTRLAGADQVALAIAASRNTYPTQVIFQPTQGGKEADGVMLASLKDPAMALVTGAAYGPLLYTDGTSLDPRTRDELKRLLGSYTGPIDGAPQVSLVGDTSVISKAVENAVKALGYVPRRIAGHDVASEIEADLPQLQNEYFGSIAVASTDDLAGLARLAEAGQGVGLVAVNGQLSAGEQQLLNHLPASAKVYALDAGARSALTQSWSGKKAGLSVTAEFDATATLQRVGASATRLAVANVNAPVDVVLAVHTWGTSLVVDPGQSNDAALVWFDHSSGSIDLAVIVDSTGAIPTTLDTALAAAISGPLGASNAPLAEMG